MPCSDQEILDRIVARDALAVAELYDRFGRLLFGIILGMLRDTDEAEDTLQDVFVQVWRGASSYRADLGSVKNWLVRIARNAAISVLRSRRMKMRQAQVSLPEDGESSAPIPKELAEDSLVASVVAREESSYLTRALSALPPEQRSLIELAFYQGYSHSEIAEMRSIPLGTVKTRIRTGMLALRARLAFLEKQSK